MRTRLDGATFALLLTCLLAGACVAPAAPGAAVPADGGPPLPARPGGTPATAPPAADPETKKEMEAVTSLVMREERPKAYVESVAKRRIEAWKAAAEGG